MQPNVLRAEYDDGTVEDVIRTGGGLRGIAINEGNLFLASRELGETTVLRSRLDGTGQTPLYSTTSSIWDLSFDYVDERLYFHDNVLQRFVSLRVDGSEEQPSLFTGRNSIESVAVNGESRFVYWMDSGSLWNAPLDGGPTHLLAAPDLALGLEVHSVALDAVHGHIFWSEWHPSDSPEIYGGRIRRANLDGTDVRTVLVSLPPGSDPDGVPVPYLHPTYLAIDPVADYIFAYNLAFGSIARASLDGTNFDPQFVEAQDVGVSTMRGMAVMPAIPEPSTLALAGVGVILLAAFCFRRRCARGS